eukprot:scaffold713_cov131-Cylindrotheca_fusiformis.AAC.32
MGPSIASEKHHIARGIAVTLLKSIRGERRMDENIVGPFWNSPTKEAMSEKSKLLEKQTTDRPNVDHHVLSQTCMNYNEEQEVYLIHTSESRKVFLITASREMVDKTGKTRERIEVEEPTKATTGVKSRSRKPQQQSEKGSQHPEQYF